MIKTREKITTEEYKACDKCGKEFRIGDQWDQIKTDKGDIHIHKTCLEELLIANFRTTESVTLPLDENKN